MKINELMIGNWVIAPTEYREKQKQVRVWQIRYTMIIDYDQDRHSIGRLEPIPITEDFLKKNGFNLNCVFNPYVSFHEGISEWEKEVKGNWITLQVGSNKIGCDWRLHVDNCDRDSIGNIDINYVHQLQNVLNILEIEMEVNV